MKNEEGSPQILDNKFLSTNLQCLLFCGLEVLDLPNVTKKADNLVAFLNEPC